MQKITHSPRLSSVGPLQTASSHIGITLQLGLSYLLAGATSLGGYFWMLQLHVEYPLIFALVAGCLVGLLTTLNVQYSLYLLALAMAHLARRLPDLRKDEERPRRFFLSRWPISSLFQLAQEITTRVEHTLSMVSLANDARLSALQQARETAAQAERNRIARELHDSIKQQIFSISVSAAAAKAYWQGDAAEDVRNMVEDIQQSAREAQVEMQALLQQLRPTPLENTSLVEALHIQAQALGFRIGAQVHVDIGELPDHEQLLPGTQEAVFRLVQEAFANIAKHARADAVWLGLHREAQSLCIEVRDDGQGFIPDRVQQGMGLRNLRERTKELHGTIEIVSQLGQGTRLFITLPLFEALRSPEEEARQRYELERATELSRRGYQLCENISYIGFGILALAVLLKLHWSVFVLCLPFALYGFASGFYYRLQVAQHAGAKSRLALELRRQQYRACLNLARASGGGIWLFLNQNALLEVGAGWWLLLATLTILAGLLLFARRQYYVDTDQYYRILPVQEVRWELKRWRQTLTRSIIFWLIGCSFGLVSAHNLFVLPPVTLAERMAYGIAVILLMMGGSMLIEQIQFRRWVHILGRSEQEVSNG